METEENKDKMKNGITENQDGQEDQEGQDTMEVSTILGVVGNEVSY